MKPKKCNTCGCEAIAMNGAARWQCCRCFADLDPGGHKKATLKSIEMKARKAQGRDLDGDLSGRIHLSVALDLINQAYHLGRNQNS